MSVNMELPLEPLTLLFFLLALGLILLTAYKDHPIVRMFALIISGFALVTALTDGTMTSQHLTIFVIMDAAMIIYNVAAMIFPEASR